MLKYSDMYYIYEMRHTPTGRVYVGQHKLRKGETPETDDYHGSGKVWKLIYKAHPEECVKVILEVVKTKKESDELEKKYIAHYRSVYGELCVNIADGGEGGCGKHSESTKQKIGEANKGRTSPNKGKQLSEEAKRKLSEAHKGKSLSEEHKRKIGEALKGRQFSEETRKKMSEGQKGEKNHMFGKRGEKSPNFGKRHSEETKQKIAESLTGKHHSEATRKKMSLVRKGRTSPNKGKKMSEEQKQKISESLKLRNANRKKNHE